MFVLRGMVTNNAVLRKTKCVASSRSGSNLKNVDSSKQPVIGFLVIIIVIIIVVIIITNSNSKFFEFEFVIIAFRIVIHH